MHKMFELNLGENIRNGFWHESRNVLWLDLFDNVIISLQRNEKLKVKSQILVKVSGQHGRMKKVRKEHKINLENKLWPFDIMANTKYDTMGKLNSNFENSFGSKHNTNFLIGLWDSLAFNFPSVIWASVWNSIKATQL